MLALNLLVIVVLVLLTFKALNSLDPGLLEDGRGGHTVNHFFELDLSLQCPQCYRTPSS